ncbi:MAG: TlpA family protein disulfide reductase [Chloroflexi bacterium]|nr:TlpA family protein disulfide reductase [Chloroflexota bacterium]
MSELPVLAALEREFAADNLVVVTVCLGSSEAQARQALQKARVSLMTLVDRNWQTQGDYGVRGTPTTYLISADGVILMSDVGYGQGKDAILRAEIRRLLHE